MMERLEACLHGSHVLSNPKGGPKPVGMVRSPQVKKIQRVSCFAHSNCDELSFNTRVS